MTQMNQPETPDVQVPIALKILVYTLFVAIVVVAIAVGVSYVNRDKEKKAEIQGIPWDVSVLVTEGESIRTVEHDGKVMTLVIDKAGRGERVVLVDTRRGLVIGSVALVSD